MSAARALTIFAVAGVAMVDPTLAWRLVLFGAAGALVVSLCWLMATGRSL